MIKFRLCKNDTTDTLREIFGAFPMRIPEERIRPGFVIGKNGATLDMRGMLGQILVDQPKIELRMQNSAVSNVNLKRTQSMDADFGLKILDGFLGGFGLGAAPLEGSLKKAKQLSFSFGNVRRRWWDKNELGTALIGKKIMLDHPSVRGVFTGPSPMEMLLVTDAIVSRSFSICADSSFDAGIDVSLDVVQNLVAEGKLDVEISRTANNCVSFEGSSYLTFAFSCIELNIDQSTGAIGVGKSRTSRSVVLATKTEKPAPQPIELDDDTFMPGMLEFG